MFLIDNRFYQFFSFVKSTQISQEDDSFGTWKAYHYNLVNIVNINRPAEVINLPYVKRPGKLNNISISIMLQFYTELVLYISQIRLCGLKILWLQSLNINCFLLFLKQ